MSDHAEVEHNPVVIAIIYMEKSFLIERNKYRSRRFTMIYVKPAQEIKIFKVWSLDSDLV